MNTKIKLILTALIGFSIALMLSLFLGTLSFKSYCKEVLPGDFYSQRVHFSYEECQTVPVALEGISYALILYVTLLLTHIFILVYVYKGKVSKTLAAFTAIGLGYLLLYFASAFIFYQIVNTITEGYVWLQEPVKLSSLSGGIALGRLAQFILPAAISLYAPSLIAFIVQKFRSKQELKSAKSFIGLTLFGLPLAIIILILSTWGATAIDQLYQGFKRDQRIESLHTPKEIEDDIKRQGLYNEIKWSSACEQSYQSSRGFEKSPIDVTFHELSSNKFILEIPCHPGHPKGTATIFVYYDKNVSPAEVKQLDITTKELGLSMFDGGTSDTAMIYYASFDKTSLEFILKHSESTGPNRDECFVLATHKFNLEKKEFELVKQSHPEYCNTGVGDPNEPGHKMIVDFPKE